MTRNKKSNFRSLFFTSALMGLSALTAGVSPALAGPAGADGEPTLETFLASKGPAQAVTRQSAEARKDATDVLIYNGDAAATGDAESIAEILSAHGTTYRMVSSSELEAMTLEELASYRLIAWPGGYAGMMTNSLSPEARGRVREAVLKRGVSYVGFCAGAFMAVSPAPEGNSGPSWGLSLISSELLPYYYLEDQGTEDAMVRISFAGGASRDILWWGGPYFPAKKEGVLGKYPNGDAAIVQGWAGNGFVVLSGPHPEAPDSWRTKLGLDDSDGADFDQAWTLMQAAMERKPLPALS